MEFCVGVSCLGILWSRQTNHERWLLQDINWSRQRVKLLMLRLRQTPERPFNHHKASHEDAMLCTWQIEVNLLELWLQLRVRLHNMLHKRHAASDPFPFWSKSTDPILTVTGACGWESYKITLYLFSAKTAVLLYNRSRVLKKKREKEICQRQLRLGYFLYLYIYKENGKGEFRPAQPLCSFALIWIMDLHTYFRLQSDHLGSFLVSNWASCTCQFL